MPRPRKDEAKRTNGEGSIYQEDGRWRVSMTYEDATGKKRRKRQWATSERDAKEKLFDMRSKVKRGIPLVPEQETVGQFMDRWLADVDIQRDTSTARGYRSIATHYVIPALGAIKLAKLLPRHISALQLRLLSEPGVKGKKLAARSVDHIYRVIHVAMEQAKAEGLIERNPADAVSPPKTQKADEVFLTKAQATRLLLAAKDHPAGGPVVLMVATGMRWSEVAGLQWRNVDFENGRVHVRKQLEWRASPWRLKEPKRKSIRTIDLPSWAMVVLAEGWERQAVQREKALDAWTEHNFVFTTSQGSPWGIGNYWRQAWRPILKIAGLDETGIKRHGLRHTHGVLLRESGEELDTIRDRLGHQTIDLTADTYGHITPKLRRGTADRLEDLLDEPDA